MDMIIKKCWTCGIKYEVYECCLEHTNIQNYLIEYKCLRCNKIYHKNFDVILKKRFVNTDKFSSHDIKKFILLLRKVAYPYENTNNSKNLTKKHYQRKFYSYLNFEDITNADYSHAKKVCTEILVKR